MADPAPFDQYMIRDMAAYDKLLESLDIRGRTVIEFGVGTGSLTRGILAQSPKQVIGYEIDPSIVPDDLAHDPRLDLRMKDFTLEDFSFLQGQPYTIIANPPYTHLPFIKALMERYPPDGVVMMVSEKKKNIFFPDDKVALTFRPDDFAPPTKNNQVVFTRGLSKHREAGQHIAASPDNEVSGIRAGLSEDKSLRSF